MAITGALPTAPVGIGADKDASQEYLAALTKVQKALENRNQINLFNVAGQFFNPGRSGQFSEALGNVATSVGKDISEQQAAEPNIAMMRAQLAGQKYTMSNDAKAAALIAQTLGVNPADASQAVSSGDMSQDQMTKLAKIYPTIAQLSPTRGDLISKMFTMNKDLADIGIKERQAVIPEARFTYETGQTLPGTRTAPASGSAPTGGGAQTGGGKAPVVSEIDAKASTVSPESQNKIKTEQILKQNEANEKFLETIPDTIKSANNRMLRGQQLVDQITGNEAAFGLLKQNPGIAQAIATWFNQGIQAGQFGSIRLPVTETMEALLPKEQQKALQIVRSILNEESLQATALLKGAVSDFETKMVQSISGSPENTAEFLKYIGQKTKLQGEFDKKVIDAYEKVQDKVLYRDWVVKSKEYGQLRSEFDKKVRDIGGATLTGMGIKPPEVTKSQADNIREEMQRRKISP
jgi:hypothetical protein